MADKRCFRLHAGSTRKIVREFRRGIKVMVERGNVERALMLSENLGRQLAQWEQFKRDYRFHRDVLSKCHTLRDVYLFGYSAGYEQCECGQEYKED